MSKCISLSPFSSNMAKGSTIWLSNLSWAACSKSVQERSISHFKLFVLTLSTRYRSHFYFNRNETLQEVRTVRPFTFHRSGAESVRCAPNKTRCVRANEHPTAPPEEMKSLRLSQWRRRCPVLVSQCNSECCRRQTVTWCDLGGLNPWRICCTTAEDLFLQR